MISVTFEKSGNVHEDIWNDLSKLAFYQANLEHCSSKFVLLVKTKTLTLFLNFSFCFYVKLKTVS